MKRFEVTDDSGFLAIVDPDAYEGFVGEDWEHEQLLERFRSQMAARRLLIWGTGSEDTWRVEVRSPGERPAGFRQATGPISSTRGRLLLTSYDSLSMAAQFADVSLPQAHERELLLEVEPGTYRCRITQLRDPDDFDASPGPCDFVVELEPGGAPDPAWQEIPWSLP
ncbi:MAG TPA: hypothetical protein VF179_16675 [Thermoanaerobaculia bacterium]|nr:hypothetical protein [Thermoanaerobaculia bacterium]